MKSTMKVAPQVASFLAPSPLMVGVAPMREREATGLSKFSGLAKCSTQGLFIGGDGATAGGAFGCGCAE